MIVSDIPFSAALALPVSAPVTEELIMCVSWSSAIRWLGVGGLILATFDVASGQTVSRSSSRSDERVQNSPVRKVAAEAAEEMEEPAAVPEWSPTRSRTAPRVATTTESQTMFVKTPKGAARPASQSAERPPKPSAPRAGSKGGSSTGAQPRRNSSAMQEDGENFRLTEYFTTNTSSHRAPQRVVSRSRRQVPMEGDIIEEGTIVEGETWSDGGSHDGGCSSCGSGGSCGDSCDSCGDSCDECDPCFRRGRIGCRGGLLDRWLCFGGCFRGGCGSCGDCGDCGDGCDECSPWIEENECDDCRRWWRRGRCRRSCRDWCWLDDLSFFGGMAGFKGPVDLGVNGNFGFSYGVNWGAPLWDRFGLGLQLGYRGVSSDLSGEPISGIAGNSRQQNFFTGGIFRRFSNENLGYWQWGVAVDTLQDNYYTTMNLSQVRVEISHFLDEFNEIGFWGALRSKGDTGTLAGLPINWQAQDQYNFFVRHTFDRGNQARLWGGFTDTSDAIVGLDYAAALSAGWGVQASGNYLIPNEGPGFAGQVNESWGLGVNLVWYPLRNLYQSQRSPYRPLFNVADNGSFMMEVVP
jgi:hypothetical protein